MDYRKFYGLRARCSIGESTFMAPQCETYNLIRNPLFPPKIKVSNFVEGNIDESEEKGDKSEEKGDESEEKGDESDFGIILNVATLKPEDITITFEEGNEIKVNVNQNNYKLEHMGGISCNRNCSYKYQLPDYIDKKSLAALRTSDDYLIILPRGNLRDDLLKESVKVAESSKEDVTSIKATSSSDLKEKNKKRKSRKRGKSRRKKGSKVAPVKVEESSKSEMVFSNETGLIPVQVTRMLKAPLDMLTLRKSLIDLESQVSMARKIIENSSFIQENSQTPEIRIQNIAKERGKAYHEEHYNRDETKRIKIDKESSSEKSSERLPLDASGEPSSSSSTKCEEPAQEMMEE